MATNRNTLDIQIKKKENEIKKLEDKKKAFIEKVESIEKQMATIQDEIYSLQGLRVAGLLNEHHLTLDEMILLLKERKKAECHSETTGQTLQDPQNGQ